MWKLCNLHALHPKICICTSISTYHITNSSIKNIILCAIQNKQINACCFENHYFIAYKQYQVNVHLKKSKYYYKMENIETFSSSDIAALLAIFPPEKNFYFFFSLRAGVIFIALIQFVFNCGGLVKALLPFFPDTTLSIYHLSKYNRNDFVYRRREYHE